jgi:hypothetical protein
MNKNTAAPTTKPDRTIRLAETSGLLARIAAAMVERHGFYTFTDVATNERVMVVK